MLLKKKILNQYNIVSLTQFNSSFFLRKKQLKKENDIKGKQWSSSLSPLVFSLSKLSQKA